MRFIGIVTFLVALFVREAYAQTTSVSLSASTTYAPTNVWAPAASCTAGSSSPAGAGVQRGGVYRDEYVWLAWIGLGIDRLLISLAKQLWDLLGGHL